jgi:hypothetical protein
LKFFVGFSAAADVHTKIATPQRPWRDKILGRFHMAALGYG